MKQTRKAIFLDIDGTLLPHGAAGPAAADVRCIERAHNAGHLVFLSTGRSLANISAEFTEAPWLDGIIAGGGAHILMADNAARAASPAPRLKTVYHRWLGPETLRTVCALFLQSPEWCLLEGETGLYMINRITGVLPSPLTKALAVEREDDFDLKYRDELISKVTMNGGITEPEQRLLGSVLQFYPQNGYHEGLIKGESKSKSMKMVLEREGIGPEHSIAIGDSMNDLDMIRAAGTGIAMGNACEELKAAAAHITASVEHCGAGLALEQFVFGA